MPTPSRAPTTRCPRPIKIHPRNTIIMRIPRERQGMDSPRRLALAAPLILVLPALAAAAELRAGASRVEITPPPGLGMYGYGNRKGGATGVLDPLMARVLVLEAAEKRLALVVMDLRSEERRVGRG